MGKRIDLTGRKCVGRGCNARIFEFGGKVIKYFLNYNGRESTRNWAYLNMLNEYEIQRDLYSAGIKVPKPYGIFRIILNKEKTFGLVMDKIDGKNLQEMYSDPKYKMDQIGKFADKGFEEVKRAEDLGFKLGDRGYKNFMVDQDKQIFLIDFGYDCYSNSNLKNWNYNNK